MTDNEIIKALEKWCDNNCKKVCPHLKMCDKCVVTYIKSALDLIKRKQAEIERLQSMNQAKLDIIHDIRAELETAKSEAIKEFAERLKSECFIDRGFAVMDYETIDTLVKEMTVNYESSKQRKEDENAVGQRSVEKR